MTNKLVRKLDVRFKRSRQKYKPIGSMKKTDAGLSNIDALDYRDADGKPFYEPTTELSLINNLYDGWFSVVLVPTNEHDNYRWHIFAYNSGKQKVEITTIRASAEGLFDVKDYTVMEPKLGAKNALVPRSIPGIIGRTLDLKDKDKDIEIEVGNGFSATTYNIQREQQTENGEMQLLKGATRIMLVIPTTQGNAAALSFAIAADGTLSQINENVDESNIVRSNSRELLLPLNTLDEIKAFGDSTPPQQGKITAISEGEEDTVQITSPQASELISGDIIQITDTQSYNGHYKAIKVDEDTFEIEASFVNGDIGNWEVVPEVETGLTFDGAITAFERVADNRLKITAENHGLEDGDEVQIVDTTDFNQTFAIEKINEKNFVIDGISWQSGEAVNLKLESRKRRGVMFEDSEEEYIEIPALELTPPSEEFAFGYTVSAWVYVADSNSNTEQIIIGEKNKCFRLLVNNGKVSFEVKFDDVKQVTDTEAVSTNKSNKWVHYAGIIKSDGTSNQTTLTLCKNGQQVGETLVEALPNTPENWQPEFEIGKSFSGKIADVRIWDAARMVKEIKDSMYLQLTGREVDLAGYWRLGAITEGKERLVVDFSANGNDGIVYGEAFVSAVTLKRTLGDGNTKVVKYSNDDLVAVTARATYVESFEFKVDGDVDSDSLFNFSYWGKKSRNSEEKIEFSGESNFKRLDNNWYKATCHFTVPDGVAMMRTFEIANVQGDWNNLEIRKHRVQLVSDSITEEKFIDSVSLETLADENTELPGLLKKLEQKEQEQASLLLKKWNLEELKELGRAGLQREIDTLHKEVERLQRIYNQEKNNLLNYWCKIKTNRNKHFHFNPDKFLTEWHNNHARFKFIAKRNGWYEIETDTKIGHLKNYGSDKKYLHFNREKVLCAWKNVRAQFRFEKRGDWYIGKLNTSIGNLRGTGFNYLHFDSFNSLVAWKDNPARFKFIKDSEEPTNDNIKNAKSKWEAKKKELELKQEQLDTITREFGGELPQQDELNTKLEEIEQHPSLIIKIA
ncbi:MAG: LamG domain-containing protein [Cyanobacteria bacterium J06628_3]